MLKYPFEPTSTGDIALATDDRTRKLSGVRLLLDCSKGDRAMLPEFGTTIAQFAPTEGDAALDAELLKLDIERWCSESFEVTAVRKGSGRYQLRVEIDA